MATTGTFGVGGKEAMSIADHGPWNMRVSYLTLTARFGKLLASNAFPFIHFAVANCRNTVNESKQGREHSPVGPFLAPSKDRNKAIMS